MTFPDRLVVYDACSLKERVFIHGEKRTFFLYVWHVINRFSASFPVSLVSPNPVALGKRWIAYSEGKVRGLRLVE